MNEESKTRTISMTSVLAALYIIANFIPFSQFIGGAAFVTFGVVFIPIMAFLLKPRYALMASIIAGLGISFFGIGLASVFPGYCILIVVVATTLGSLAFHERLFAWFPAAFLLVEGIGYLLFYNFEATPFWLIHYSVGIVLSILATLSTLRIWKFGLIFSIAMCENAMMNIGSMLILGLPAFLWTIITPASIMERTIASIGAILIIGGLRKFAPGYFPEVFQ